MTSRRHSFAAALLVAVFAAALVGCGDDTADAPEPKGDCPVGPVQVVVSVDQWGDVVRQLAGDCAEVTTIVDGAAGDPHEFEPTPSDVAAFDGADLVVVNGLGYDTWATDAVASSSGEPKVIDAGEIAGSEVGDNPHVWYDPTVVRETATAVTQALQEVSPREAEEYYTDRFQRWEQALAPYDAAIERIRAGATGRPYAATESVFDLMAAALGLTDVTPSGYRDAAANESEPAPADVDGFETALRDRKADVLIDNTQTEGPLPQQLADVARQAGVPVVPVTETVPADAGSFVEWQVAQLDALAAALGL
ncbi:metal ABC transporter solute-binding protein, Zn/Mn family [Dermatobacter hominis]|uniref:metal ABC transporter solute-binding protein, Zn/Mn family n=1 Tax=Dermatobacter hominis TaxID=2884263 RepID=UPI001D1033CC|nr:zinc ABC transporter substrate-binding protein [Dermatobacter hominis]UDY37235.1 zinc ABC transporter substrate-binding protein [Dermatobacter hominis]